MELLNLYDTSAATQCLGALVKQPSLLDEYSFKQEDFLEKIHRLTYSVIYNLYNTGVESIDYFTFDSYLKQYPKQHKEFEKNGGADFFSCLINLYNEYNITYYYNKLKKFSLLRDWEKQGVDTSLIYDPNDTVKVQTFDSYTVEEMIDIVEERIVGFARMEYATNSEHKGQLAGKDLKSLKESFKEEPDYGVPMQSPILSTISRGCRLKKFYLRSGSSGSGKTRLGMADMASISIPYYYNWKKEEWEYTGFCEPVLMISTELEISEIQTILVAYISGVSEDHIRDGKYKKNEEEIVDQAIEYISQSPFHIEELHDFSIAEVEQLIKRYRREKSVYYFFFDYIHMSNKLIMEISNMSKGMKLREDQILFLFSDSLKNLCNKLDVFILSSTQLNGSYKDSAEKDETMLRGAKNLADRIDLGEISLPPSPSESKMLEKITQKIMGCPPINLIRHVYKLRGGKWSKIKICQYANLGTARTEDVFVLNKDNKVIDIPVINLQSVNKEHSELVENIIKDNSVNIKEMPDNLDVNESEDDDVFDW